MSHLRMSPTTPLTSFGVITSVLRRNMPGNYRLGRLGPRGEIIVDYVGRSDTCLRTRLLQHANDGKHQFFQFHYASSDSEAYHRELIEYFEFGGPMGILENKVLPDLPASAGPYKNALARIVRPNRP